MEIIRIKKEIIPLSERITDEISFLNYLIEYPELCREKCKERINNLKLQIIENKSEKQIHKSSLQNLKEELEETEISFPLDTTDEFDKGFRYACNLLKEKIDKTFEKHIGGKNKWKKE